MPFVSVSKAPTYLTAKEKTLGWLLSRGIKMSHSLPEKECAAGATWPRSPWLGRPEARCWRSTVTAWRSSPTAKHTALLNYSDDRDGGEADSGDQQ